MKKEYQAWQVIRKNIKLQNGSAVELSNAIYKLNIMFEKRSELNEKKANKDKI